MTAHKTCVIKVYMNSTHNSYHQHLETDKLVELLSAKNLLSEKTRINLYLPRIVVKLMDKLAKNISRGELVSSLIIKEVKKSQKLPYGMFSPLEIPEEEIDKVASKLEKTVNELT